MEQVKHNIEEETSDECEYYQERTYADCVDEALWKYFKYDVGCVPPYLSDQ